MICRSNWAFPASSAMNGCGRPTPRWRPPVASTTRSWVWAASTTRSWQAAISAWVRGWCLLAAIMACCWRRPRAAPSSCAQSRCNRRPDSAEPLLAVDPGASGICASAAQAFNQRHGGGGRADLALVDHVKKDVACRLFGGFGLDHGQVGRCAAGGPGLSAFGPGVEILCRIAGGDRIIAFLQARVDEITGHVGNRRVGLVLGKHHRRLVLAQQTNELWRCKRGMPDLDHVPELEPIELCWQHRQKRPEVGRVELLGRRKLPQDRSQPVAQFGDARLQEKAKRLTGLRQQPLLHDVARPLDREHEAIGNLLAPFGESGRRLRAVEGAVDLDGGELGAGICELLGVRQTLRIEGTAPGFERPAANADPDLACLRHRSDPNDYDAHARQKSPLAQGVLLPLQSHLCLPGYFRWS